MTIKFTSILLLAAALAPAASITVTYTDSGWYTNSSGTTQATSAKDYIAGQGGATEYRSFFTFAIPNLPGGVTSATFRVFNPAGGFDSSDISETVAIWDVTTSISNLVTRTFSTAFADLGGGNQYSSKVVTAADNDTLLEFVLSSQAISAINSAQGNNFALGASLTSLKGGSFEYVFSSSFPTSLTRELVLTYQERNPNSAVPEPSTVALTAAGLALALKVKRRR